MKYLPVVLLLILGCNAPKENFTNHGESITSENVISTIDFINKVNDEEQVFKVRGVVEEVCQKKGCWMTLKNEEGANIRITFKDYGFFVPKDINGQEVIVEGVAKKEIIDEDVAKHYAEDGGKEYDPSMKNSITLVANGVLIKEDQSAI
ncbi:DUF4920 domain-containing protein [Ekhidna sp.]|uniref:DUF4920 domain-containing protein n=1 Tax=Ekhidna sp. TaxID=2608089 RepID=UPI003B514FB3